MSAPNILLVDDEPSVLRYTKTLLEIENYHVETAASGEEALAADEPRTRAEFDCSGSGDAGNGRFADFGKLQKTAS